ncbi:hypothetical protein [Microbispora rosea]
MNELGHVALVGVLTAVLFGDLAFRLGVCERAGGAGRDRPKSRSPAG